MATVSKTRTYSTGSQLTATNYNDDRDEIIAGVNDITNAQINAAAGIEASKISDTAVTLTATQTVSNKTLGTGTKVTQGSDGTGDTYYRAADGTFTRLAVGSTGQIMTVAGGLPSWASTVTQSEAWTDATDGATITFNLASGASSAKKQRVTLGGNRTLDLSNVGTGQAFILRLQQDATGSRTVTWFSTIRWSGGSAPTLTTTANKADVFGFIQTGTGTYDGFIVGQNL